MKPFFWNAKQYERIFHLHQNEKIKREEKTNFSIQMCLHQIDLHTRLNRKELRHKTNQRQQVKKKKGNRFSLRIVSYFCCYSTRVLLSVGFVHFFFYHLARCLPNHKRIQSDEKRAQYLCKCDFFFFSTLAHFIVTWSLTERYSECMFHSTR